MYASMRTYRMGTGAIGDLMHRVDRDFAEALAQEPGFIAYQAIDMGGGKICTISVFADRAVRTRDLAGSVAGAVVHHERRRVEAADLWRYRVEDGTDARRLVVSGDQDGDLAAEALRMRPMRTRLRR